MITFENITKVYRHQETEIKALNKINLTIDSHEIFGVIGESGSGKSSLLRMINTLEQPDEGKIKIDALLLNDLTKEQQRRVRKKSSMIFQHFNLLYNQTVFQNVHLPLTLTNKKDEKRVFEILDFVQMSGKEQFYPNS
ncbi:ATP-binding cassette domain-containing protein [Enterococcus rivorum]|uniref:ATP-binding cassette domain-containing protein n=1 Tax=Enterococcus rivorum TaxID=762845 RepID=UPI00363DB285